MKALINLIFICALFLAPALRAEEVQATVVSVSGKAQFTDGSGQEQDLKAGAMLRQGARVRTSASSLVQLMLADGSKLSLGPNTDLTLSEMSRTGEAFGNVFNLFKGLIRATVNKLTVGSKFEVASTHGVAAVKGTEYEAEADEHGMDVRVKEGRVWLSDLRREHVEEIRERHRGRCVRDKVERAVEMQKEEWEAFREWRRAELPPATPQQQERARLFWERLRPDQRLKVLQELRRALGDTWSDITTLREEERQSRWRERVRNVDERRLAAEDAHIDFTLGKSLIDRHGRRVRFEEFLMRPAPDQLQFLNYSKRDGRTDLLTAVNYYNKALPRLLHEAKGMNQKEWNQATAPEYWATRQTILFGNDLNDSLFGDTRYFDPVKPVLVFNHWELPVQSVELWANVPIVFDPITGIDGTTFVHTASGGTLLEAYQRYDNYGAGTIRIVGSSGPTPVGSATGNNMIPGGVGALGGAQSSDLRWVGGIGFVGLGSGSNVAPVSVLLTAAQLGTTLGDLAMGIKRTYADGTTLQIRGFAIDENGKVRNLQDLLNKPLFDAYTDLAFRTYQEVEIGSSLFRRDIDVVSQMLWWSTITKTSDRL